MIFAIWKPVGLTSHDVVDRVRRVTGESRVGHGGTLDPLAEGVLIVGVGREATKQLGAFQKGHDKTYEAVFRLGASSATDDGEGPIVPREGVEPPSEEAVRLALRAFEGEISQRPPQYSAVKLEGIPAHRRSRRGEQVALTDRRVVIRQVTLAGYRWPDVAVSIVCGSGVYIRSLARDLGEALGTGGYVISLKRTLVGAFSGQETVELESLPQWWNDHRPATPSS